MLERITNRPIGKTQGQSGLPAKDEAPVIIREHNFADKEIRPVAYALWETKGKLHGSDQEDWFNAIDNLLIKQEKEERTRKRAYFLWEAAGKPEGNGVDFWLQAEKQVEEGDRTIKGLKNARIKSAQETPEQPPTSPAAAVPEVADEEAPKPSEEAEKIPVVPEVPEAQPKPTDTEATQQPPSEITTPVEIPEEVQPEEITEEDLKRYAQEQDAKQAGETQPKAEAPQTETAPAQEDPKDKEIRDLKERIANLENELKRLTPEPEAVVTSTEEEPTTKVEATVPTEVKVEAPEGVKPEVKPQPKEGLFKRAWKSSQMRAGRFVALGAGITLAGVALAQRFGYFLPVGVKNLLVRAGEAVLK